MDAGDNIQQLQKFQDWLEANGAMLEKLELRDCGPHGNGVYARETIRDNEQYANIPSDLIITSDVCRKELKDVLSVDLSGRALLCAFLIHQRFVCTESFWKPYIDILPQTFHTPLHFTTEDLLLLRGTPMEYAVEDRRSELYAEYKRVQEAVDSKADMCKALDFDNYLWAATVVSSRAFTKALLNVGREDISDTNKEDLKQVNAGAKASVLLPLLDMMNHRPQALITWLVDSDSGSISFVAGSDVAAGSEVANNYGAKSNEELLLGYGFCASPNPLNCYHIKLNYSQDPLFIEKRQILEAAGIDACDHYIRAHQLPRNLLPMLRVMAMTETDVYYLRKIINKTPDNVEWLQKSMGLRIELRARFLLARLLDGKLNILKNTASVDTTETENAKLALQYRNELEDILRTTIDNLHRDENSLMLFAHSLLSEDRHALPTFMAEGAISLPTEANDTETDTEPKGQDVKRARAMQPAQLFLEDVLITLDYSLDQDAEFSQAVEQIDVDEDVLLTLFVLRCRAFTQSPWHTAVKRLENFKHPMLLLEDDPTMLESYGEMMMEMGEIHDSLFPLLNEHFPNVFPLEHFTSELFLWAAGIVESCRVSVPAWCVHAAKDQNLQDVEGLLLI
ncbi:hypothetical protein H4S08_000345 [Coemansia sp. RSA 1365]|nr:hypothetical protein H4S08_000345 [Coemansia sp. RSA 1365]